jgi:hypothetical protein
LVSSLQAGKQQLMPMARPMQMRVMNISTSGHCPEPEDSHSARNAYSYKMVASQNNCEKTR